MHNSSTRSRIGTFIHLGIRFRHLICFAIDSFCGGLFPGGSNRCSSKAHGFGWVFTNSCTVRGICGKDVANLVLQRGFVLQVKSFSIEAGEGERNAGRSSMWNRLWRLRSSDFLVLGKILCFALTHSWIPVLSTSPVFEGLNPVSLEHSGIGRCRIQFLLILEGAWGSVAYD